MASNNQQRKFRHNRIRAVVSGSSEKPRLNVYRSTNHIYVQIIDDEAGKTLVSASSKEIKDIKKNKKDIAAMVGKLAAEKALKSGIKKVVFDRGGYKYHGRVKNLADSAREGGLEF